MDALPPDLSHGKQRFPYKKYSWSIPPDYRASPRTGLRPEIRVREVTRTARRQGWPASASAARLATRRGEQSAKKPGRAVGAVAQDPGRFERQ